jgi:hypothetical protein
MEGDSTGRDRSVGFVVGVLDDESWEVLVGDVELEEVQEDPEDDGEDAREGWVRCVRETKK